MCIVPPKNHRASGWSGVALAAFLGLTVLARGEPASPAPAAPAPDYVRSLLDLARPEVRERKLAVLRQSMELTEKESAAFWAVHAEYDKAMQKWFDEKLALIEEYARTYETMTDSQARELGRRVFSLDEQRIALKRKFWPRFEKVVPARTVARFFQLDNQINLAIDLNIAARLPLIK